MNGLGGGLKGEGEGGGGKVCHILNVCYIYMNDPVLLFYYYYYYNHD